MVSFCKHAFDGKQQQPWFWCVAAGHEGKVTGLVLLPNDLVLSCSEDRSLRVWDLKTMKQLHVSDASSVT